MNRLRQKDFRNISVEREELFEMLFILSKCLVRKASFTMFGFAEVGEALHIASLIDSSTCYHDTNNCEEEGVPVTHVVGFVSLEAWLFLLLSLQQCVWEFTLVWEPWPGSLGAKSGMMSI